MENDGGKEEVQVKRIARSGTKADEVAEKSAAGAKADEAGFELNAFDILSTCLCINYCAGDRCPTAMQIIYNKGRRHALSVTPDTTKTNADNGC